MPDASALQTSFLGGEFSPYYQGRMDDPLYRSGMNVCLNTIPIEEGSAVRRPGTAFAATTRNGAKAQLRLFDFSVEAPYQIEFTDGHIRFFAGLSLVLDPNPPVVLGINSANPALVETAQAHGWSTGDQVQFGLPVGGVVFLGMTPLLNRQLAITVVDAFHFTIADPVTGAGVDGSTITLGLNTLIVSRVTTFTTPYTNGQWAQARIVQNDAFALILVPGFPVYLLTSSFTVSNVFANFTFAQAVFSDGPYLDPPTDGSTATPSGLTGTITVSFSATTSINGGAGFNSSDVGRMIRLFSEPQVWSSGTPYAANQSVKFDGAYYTAIVANTNVQPDTDLTKWAVSTTAAVWTWGFIVTVASVNQVTMAIQPASVDLEGNPRADGNLLYTTPITTWRLGAFSANSGYPTSGTYYEGRFYLMGAIGNRFDATKSNELLRFDPTGQDGTVADNNGITETLNSDNIEQIYWAIPTAVGVVVGTKAGEWLIQASNLSDPVTPTSIQAHRVTKYGCANIEPRQTGLSIAFVQRYGRKTYEYIADVYSGKFSGTNLSLKAKHLSIPGVAEIAYQRELTPVLWERCNDGSLIGCTYKRESPFGTQPASFSGWHRHSLGSGRIVESIQVGPSIGGDIDSLMMVTNDISTNVRFVEMLTDIFDENKPNTAAWFVDAGIVPFYAQQSVDGTGLDIYGYWPLIGKTVSVFAGGLDLGDYVVQAGGKIHVPYQSDPDKLFTKAYLDALNASGVSFAPLQTGVEFIVTTGDIAPNPTTIQAYNPSLGVKPTFGWASRPDWAGGRIFLNGGGYLASFEIAGNAQINEVLLSTVGGDTASGMFYGGDYIWYATQLLNNPIWNILNADTLAEAALPGTIGGDARNSGFSFPLVAVAAKGAGNAYCFYINQASAIAGNVLNFATGIPILAYGIIPTAPLYRNGGMCVGIQNAQIITAFAVSSPGNGSPTTDPSGICKIAVWDDKALLAATNYYDSAHTYGVGDVVQFSGVWYSSLTAANTNHQPDTHPVNWKALPPQGMRITEFVTFHAADIDPTWTHFDGVSGKDIVYDETDGCVIVQYSTLDAVTTPSYFVKVNPTDGSIVWKMPNQSTLAFSPDTRIQRQRMNIIVNNGGSDMSLIVINTKLGTVISTTNVHGLQAAGGFFSDDVTGFLVGYFQYTSGGGAPTPVGGTTSGTYQLMRIQADIGPASSETTDQTPLVAGFTYTSQGQILRTINPQEAGAQTGPALGMTRRSHMFSALLHNTQGISFGTNFTSNHAANFKTKGGTPLTKNQLFSGVYWDTLDSDYSFDDMLCWSITRPYPANVLAFGAFHHTQDR